MVGQQVCIMQNIVSRPFSLYGSYCLFVVARRRSPFVKIVWYRKNYYARA